MPTLDTGALMKSILLAVATTLMTGCVALGEVETFTETGKNCRTYAMSLMEGKYQERFIPFNFPARAQWGKEWNDAYYSCRADEKAKEKK